MPFGLFASVFLPLASLTASTGIRLAACCLVHRSSRIGIASINRAAKMRATTLVLLVAGAAALQPTLRVHAAARPTRTSGCPVQKTTKGIYDMKANRF